MNTKGKLFQKCIKKIQNKALICRPNHEFPPTKNGTFYVYISMCELKQQHIPFWLFFVCFTSLTVTQTCYLKVCNNCFPIESRSKILLKGGSQTYFFYVLNATFPLLPWIMDPLMNNTWMIYIYIMINIQY